MDLLLDMFTYPFILRAFVVGVLIALCAALLGVPLVLKRCSMIGDGLSHVSFGALSIALACGWAPLPVSIPVVVLAALGLLKEPCIVELYSDSKYVVDALEKGWLYGWQKRGWIKADKKPVLNVDLWQQLLPLLARHDVRLHWVKGHAENEKNNRCDQLAVAESKKFR